LRAHKPARKGLCANEKNIQVGSIDSSWCSHEVGEKGLRNPPRTRLNHCQTLSRNPRPLKSTREFPSLNPPTQTRQDEITTDLIEDSDNAGARDVELTLQSLLRQLECHHNLTKDLDVSPIEVREIADFRCDEVAVRGVALIAQDGKLVDNFSPKSDVTSLQDPFTSRPYKTPF